MPSSATPGRDKLITGGGVSIGFGVLLLGIAIGKHSGAGAQVLVIAGAELVEVGIVLLALLGVFTLLCEWTRKQSAVVCELLHAVGERQKKILDQQVDEDRQLTQIVGQQAKILDQVEQMNARLDAMDERIDGVTEVLKVGIELGEKNAADGTVRTFRSTRGT
jgi:hypothetical protein